MLCTVHQSYHKIRLWGIIKKLITRCHSQNPVTEGLLFHESDTNTGCLRKKYGVADYQDFKNLHYCVLSFICLVSVIVWRLEQVVMIHRHPNKSVTCSLWPVTCIYMNCHMLIYNLSHVCLWPVICSHMTCHMVLDHSTLLHWYFWLHIFFSSYIIPPYLHQLLTKNKMI